MKKNMATESTDNTAVAVHSTDTPDTSNSLMVSQTNASDPMIEALKSSKNFLFSSIVMDGTRETAIKVYNAINVEGTKIADMLGKEIKVQDIIAHPVQLVDDVTGEISQALRMVFISPDGSTYASVASGIYNSVQKLFPIMGMPPYNPYITIVPNQSRTRKGNNVITFGLA